MLTVRRAISASCVLALTALPISAQALIRHPAGDIPATAARKDRKHRKHHRHHRHHRRRAHHGHSRPQQRRIVLAGDPGVTIADFQFSPGTITIHTGDTITWSNSGPSAHTATASDGSFDTGTLQKGQSASHTFSQAGTFAYECKIHPFMHGTIVVQGSSGSGSSSSGASGSSSAAGSSASSGSSGSGGGSATAGGGSSGASGAATSASSGNLPLTGYDLRSTLLCGGLLLLVGLAIRGRVGKRQLLHRK